MACIFVAASEHAIWENIKRLSRQIRSLSRKLIQDRESFLDERDSVGRLALRRLTTFIEINQVAYGRVSGARGKDQPRRRRSIDTDEHGEDNSSDVSKGADEDSELDSSRFDGETLQERKKQWRDCGLEITAMVIQLQNNCRKLGARDRDRVV